MSSQDNQDKKEWKSVNDRLNSWIEKIAFTAISVGVSVTATFQWQLYKEQMVLIEAIKSHDTRITSLEMEVAQIKGNMVGWDTLKRIELYLSTMNSKDANSALLNALKAESGARSESSPRK